MSRDTRWMLLAESQAGPYMHGLEPGLPGWAEWQEVSCSGFAGGLEDHLDELAEGGWVVDMRGFDLLRATKHAVQGPLLALTYAASTRRTLFGQPEVVAPDVPLSGTDTVSLDLYVTFAHRAGAKVGQKVNGQIVWRE